MADWFAIGCLILVACCFGALVWGLLFSFSRFCLVVYVDVILLCLRRLACSLLVALVVGSVVVWFSL